MKGIVVTILLIAHIANCHLGTEVLTAKLLSVDAAVSLLDRLDTENPGSSGLPSSRSVGHQKETPASAGHLWGEEALSAGITPFAEAAAAQAVRPLAAYMDFYVGQITSTLGTISGLGPEFSAKARPIVINVVNRADNVVSGESWELVDQYAWAGRIFHSPPTGSTLNGNAGHFFYFANRDNSVMTGVNGEIKYKSRHSSKTMTIGFSNPYIGSLKVSAYLNVDKWVAWYCNFDVNGPGISLKNLARVPPIVSVFIPFVKQGPRNKWC
jgi:hypothetical protein